MTKRPRANPNDLKVGIFVIDPRKYPTPYVALPITKSEAKASTCFPPTPIVLSLNRIGA